MIVVHFKHMPSKQIVTFFYLFIWRIIKHIPIRYILSNQFLYWPNVNYHKFEKKFPHSIRLKSEQQPNGIKNDMHEINIPRISSENCARIKKLEKKIRRNDFSAISSKQSRENEHIVLFIYSFVEYIRCTGKNCRFTNHSRRSNVMNVSFGSNIHSL